MKLTLKKFRELTKDLSGDYLIETTIEFGKPSSLRGIVNEVHICPSEHTHSGESFITLTQDMNDNVRVKQLIGKNEWTSDR